ncbi:MAG: hypothetical protein WEB60_03085 [Terrimicrobiaceae bacterium]
MTASELFAGLLPEQAASLLGEIRETNRPLLQSATAVLAGRRKLRPAFIDKKAVPERLAWVAGELSRKSNADVAIEILQGWLFAAKKPMLLKFLDMLGVSHDGEGLIEELPAEPPREKVVAAVESLLASDPAWAVSLYLRLFIQMDEPGWTVLRELIETDARLKLPTP